MLGKFLDPKNGFAFRQVFGQKNKDILIHFLNDVLGADRIGQIKEVTFLERPQGPEIASKKESMADVRCRDELGRECVIEIDMQVAKKADFEKRVQYHAARTYASIPLAEHFDENFRGVIFLGIVNFLISPEQSSIKSDHVLMSSKQSAIKSDHTVIDRSTHEQDLQGFSFTFIELPKLKKSVEELESPLDYWCYYLKHAQETSSADYELLIVKHPIIQRAYEALDRFYWSQEELQAYEAWMKL
ncbi:MAG: Rpn family recombination-promoting nuclease/putative transposase [Bacteroidota bacterium]